MNMKYYVVVTEILEKRFGKDKVKELRENAQKKYKQFSRKDEFQVWLTDHCLESAVTLFDEHGVKID